MSSRHIAQIASMGWSPRWGSLWMVIPSVSTIHFVSVNSFSYTRSRDRPGKTQQTGIFCGKSFIAFIFRSKRARARERMAKPRPFLRRIILCLGRVTPWLAAAHQPSCRHREVTLKAVSHITSTGKSKWNVCNSLACLLILSSISPLSYSSAPLA